MATAPSEATKRFRQERWTWAEFVAWLDLDAPTDHKDCGNFVGGLLRDRRRTKDTVVSRSLVALDADKAGPGFLTDLLLTLEDTALAAYTTWRHGIEGHRYRVVAPLSRDVSPEEYRLIVGAIVQELGPHQFDIGSAQPERLMHKPSKQSDAYDWLAQDGEPLDADEWVARAKALGLDQAPAAPAVGYDGPEYADLTPEQRGQADNYRDVRLFDWEATLTEAANWTEGERDEKGRGWEALTRDFAWTLARLASFPWVGLSQEAAEETYRQMLPEPIAADCPRNWDTDLAKAASQPAEVPPWAAVPERDPALGWQADDLDSVWDADPLKPDVGATQDGRGLFYRGLVNVVWGPSESGKSWLVLRVAQQVIRDGGRVAFFDFEDSRIGIKNRLKHLGISRDAVREGRFVRVSFDQFREEDRDASAPWLATFDMVVIDAYTEAASVVVPGSSSDRADDVALFHARFASWLSRLGPAVVLVDHTSKEPGRGMLGSQHKKSIASGAAYEVVPVEPFGVDGHGESKVFVDKDKQGGVEFVRDGNRRWVGMLTAFSGFLIEDRPLPREEAATAKTEGRDDKIVASLVQAGPHGLSGNGVLEALKGTPWAIRKQDVTATLTRLAEAGRVAKGAKRDTWVAV